MFAMDEKTLNRIEDALIPMMKMYASEWSGMIKLLDEYYREEGDPCDLDAVLESRITEKCPKRKEDFNERLYDEMSDRIDEEISDFLNSLEVEEVVFNILKEEGFSGDFDGSDAEDIIDDVITELKDDYDFWEEAREIFGETIGWNVGIMFDYPVLLYLKEEPNSITGDCDFRPYEYLSDEPNMEELNRHIRDIERRYNIRIPKSVREKLVKNLICIDLYTVMLGAVVNGEDLYNETEMGISDQIDIERLYIILYNPFTTCNNFEEIPKEYWENMRPIKEKDMMGIDCGDHSIGHTDGLVLSLWRYENY